jgi:hypothetical protein
VNSIKLHATWCALNVLFPLLPILMLCGWKRYHTPAGADGRFSTLWTQSVADGQLSFYAAAIMVASLTETFMPRMEVTPFVWLQIFVAGSATWLFVVANGAHNAHDANYRPDIVGKDSNMLALIAILIVVGTHVTVVVQEHEARQKMRDLYCGGQPCANEPPEH